MNHLEKLTARIAEQHAAHGEDAEIVVSLEDFFTGNDDPGSIGCNLGEEQPSINRFYETFLEIRNRPNVQDMLVRIYSQDDPDEWPFTDTVYILSSATTAEIESWVSPLLPDEVIPEWMYGKPPEAPELQAGMTPYSVWWD
ncbi:MAG: hypothetical protein FWC42_02105 [Proteobacteria bacterium]|nr:hypothetical protein [Pseudomonadota bacterium]